MDLSFHITFTTIPRLFLYGAFLYKTKDMRPYYYIWLPALTSFVHAGLYFATPSISHDAALHWSLVAMIWLAIAKYWGKLDKSNLRYKTALIYYFIVVPILLLLVGLFIWYINKKSTPCQGKVFSTVISAYVSTATFIAMVRNHPESLSASSSIAVYAFACIVSLSPAESIVEAFAAVYGDKWVYADKVFSIAHFAAFFIETLPFALIMGALQGNSTWPSFKKPVEDPELGPSYGSIH